MCATCMLLCVSMVSHVLCCVGGGVLDIAAIMESLRDLALVISY